MKKTLRRTVCAFLCAALLFSFASCGSESTNGETLAEGTQQNSEQSLTEALTEILGEALTGEDETAQSVTGESETDVEESTALAAIPQTPQEILDAYTLVMNKAKTDKAGYKKVEWQELPDDSANRNIQKTSGILPMSQIINAILNLVNNNYMTSESDAKAEPQSYDKGGDMKWFPVCKTPKGCMLTDASAISKATCTELDSGNLKISITLKSEMNPEPANDGASTAPSNHGRVFSPLSRVKDIDPELEGNLVQAIAKDLVYDLKYFNCETILVYNPDTNEAISLTQYFYVKITGTGKVLGCGIDVMQVIKNTMEIWDIKY